MLESGGLLDQPAGLWFNANMAVALEDTIKRYSEPGFSPASITSKSEADLHTEITRLISQYVMENPD
jgi:hypothetical protein